MSIFVDSVNQLTDTAEADAIPAIKRVADSVEGVMESSDVRARRMGPQMLVDLRIRVDSQMSASAVQQVCACQWTRVMKEGCLSVVGFGSPTKRFSHAPSTTHTTIHQPGGRPGALANPAGLPHRL